MNSVFRLTQRGSTEILLALGVVCLLMITPFTVHLQTSGTMRNLMERINRVESFYTNEVMAWHVYYRGQDNLAPIVEADGQGEVFGKFCRPN